MEKTIQIYWYQMNGKPEGHQFLPMIKLGLLQFTDGFDIGFSKTELA
jgi:hypothetical protein